MRDRRIVVLGSGFGSNFQAIYEYFRNKPVRILAVISDNPKAFILERARKVGIEAISWNYKELGRRKFNQILLSKLESLEPLDLVVLAGYMRILPPEIVKRFEGRIVNIHPSLLPAFKGLNAIRKAYEYGVKVTGITIHYVSEEVDEGRIIEQVCVRIDEDDTPESLERKIHEVEHETYPKVIEKLLGL